AVVVPDGVSREMARDTAGQQHDGVDQRNRVPVHVELIGRRRWGRRPPVVRPEKIEVHREEASEEHHLGGKEDVHAHHPRLDGRIFRGVAPPQCRYGHQWWTSPPAAPASLGNMRTSSTRTQPATATRKITPPTIASVSRTSDAKGIAARPRKRTPRQITKGQLLFGKIWIPSWCARAS